MKYILPPEVSVYADKSLRRLTRKLPFDGATARLSVSKPLRSMYGNKYRLHLEVYGDKKLFFSTIDAVPHLFAGIDIVCLKALLTLRPKKQSRLAT